LYDVDRQFLVGANILISPVLEENQTKLRAYLPSGSWYSYYNGERFNKTGWTVLDAPLDFIPIHIRGGAIIPTQEPANNTVFSRQKPFGLIIALNEDGEARGDLFYDDGYSVDYKNGDYYFNTFFVRSNKLEMNVEHAHYSKHTSNFRLNKIRLFTNNDDNLPVSFVLNGQRLSPSQVQFKNNRDIMLSDLNVSMSEPFSLSWFDYDYDAAQTDTLIDCSVENRSITEEDCTAKSCHFDKLALANVPKCTIPKGVGGYVLSTPDSRITALRSSESQFLLKRADKFSLYGKEIENVLVKVVHGVAGKNFGITRIKVCLQYFLG
jgi:maltase-glucoamylase